VLPNVTVVPHLPHEDRLKAYDERITAQQVRSKEGVDTPADGGKKLTTQQELKLTGKIIDLIDDLGNSGARRRAFNTIQSHVNELEATRTRMAAGRENFLAQLSPQDASAPANLAELNTPEATI
jgi:hypothetical protein